MSKLYFLDLEALKQHNLFLEYRERLLHMVGIHSTQDQAKRAEEYLFDKYPEYRQFKVD